MMNMSGHTQGPIDRLGPYSITFERIRLLVTLKIPGPIIMIISLARVPLQSVSIQLSAADTNIFEIWPFRVRRHIQRGDFSHGSMWNLGLYGTSAFMMGKSACTLSTNPHTSLLMLKMQNKDVKAHISTGKREQVDEVEHYMNDWTWADCVPNL